MYSRFKSLHPTIDNITDEQVPIPIESAFFLEDGKPDKDKFNRYYFDFPHEWCTANRGETIIGVRNINMLARRRKLEFDLRVRKYLRCTFDDLKNKNPDKTNDEIYDMLTEKQKAEVSSKIISWLGTEHDFRKLFDDVEKQIKPKFEEYNKNAITKHKIALDTIKDALTSYGKILQRYYKPITGPINLIKDVYGFIFKTKDEYDAAVKEILDFKRTNADKLIPLFHQDDIDRSNNDLQMDGYYDYSLNTFIETLFSPNNVKIENSYIFEELPPQTADQINKLDPINVGLYYIDFKITFNERETDSNYRRYDFADVMNIGYGPNQNNPQKYKNVWLRRLDFYNVWDRQPCKICSSIAEQSSRHYIGNSAVDFIPIKYYKLNSTDQGFWIEFYSGSHNNIPIKIPRNESFCIEMQFLPFDKMLYT